MLHEGLGSAGLWGDFPDRLQAATGAGVLAYSRAGYGASTAVTLPRPLDYMHVEALEVLPELLDRIGFRRGLLLGHSDGASIAAIYAGGMQDHRVQGVAMIAPHFVVEEIGLACDRRDPDRLRDRRAQGKTRALAWRCRQCVLRLERRLARPRISRAGISRNSSPISACRWRSCRAPTINTAPSRQIEIAREECYCPVEVTMIPGAGHSPHRDVPGPTLDAIAAFAGRILCPARRARAGGPHSTMRGGA